MSLQGKNSIHMLIIIVLIISFQLFITTSASLKSSASSSSSSSSVAAAAAAAAASSSSSSSSTNNEDDEDYLIQREHVLEKSYHGLIRENETFVEITPLIKVDEQKICDFRILKKLHHEVPFQIELVNNLGILKARRSLNCEKRKSYRFEIAAIFCDGSRSNSANVHISVIDINEYAPTFLQPSYVTEVEEGRLYQEIIRVEATDKDCTPLFGDVCKYEILNNDQPFTIDNEGSIKNTEPLSHKKSHNHILSVVAYDCAMKQSSPIMVSIKVRRVCEAKLVGIPERIDYTAYSMESLLLFPNIHLELCDVHCNNEDMSIHTSISLKTTHISFGCDRDISQCSQGDNNNNNSHNNDNNSNNNNNNNNNNNENNNDEQESSMNRGGNILSEQQRWHNLIDLLPKGAEWTKDLNYDEGIEPVFHFDGSSGAIIPDNVIQRHDFATRPFSIVTMFRHFSPPTANKHAKEHIICSADDHKMNRHHMALFVRNCRLILLLRKNFNEGDLNIFSPAEWRWKIPQVCDNEWHHYVLNIDLPKIELYIDGSKFDISDGGHDQQRHNNPEVIDDWPLHAAHGVNTTLTVGSCYQGTENRLKHGFNGDIAEIKLSINNILTAEDIKCTTVCAEHLIPPSEKYLESEQQIQTNSQLNEIYIDGINKSNIELLLQKIQYTNTKQNPTIGRRNIEVRTTLTCPNQNAVRLPTVESYIMVNEQPLPSSVSLSSSSSSLSSIGSKGTPSSSSSSSLSSSSERMEGTLSSSIMKHEIDTTINNNGKYSSLPSTTLESHIANENVKLSDDQPKIIISGNPNHLVSYPDIKEGVHILANINISVFAKDEIQANLQTLDTCAVSVFPSLNPDHEEIALDGDETLSSALDIKTNINKDGVEMIGYDSIISYLDVLKALVYTNKKPAYYLNRVFKLTCSQVSSRFKSAEYTLTLTVLHPKRAVTTTTMNPNMGQQQSQHESNMFAHAMIHSHDVQEPKSHIHSIVHKAQNSHPTMLIIVICVFFVILLCGVSIARLRNNNQKYLERHQPCPKIAAEQLDWDDSALTITINPMQNDIISEESSDSENSDSEDEEVVNGKYKNVSQLEWDNSTM